MALPDSTAPTSRNSMKAGYDIANYAKKEKNVSLSLSIKLRDIDGKKSVIGTCESYYYQSNGERIIPKEFTTAAAFKKYISDMIDSVYDQIGK
jgi:hypothetical protein